jgi:hypothetical protein
MICELEVSLLTRNTLSVDIALLSITVLMTASLTRQIL